MERQIVGNSGSDKKLGNVDHIKVPFFPGIFQSERTIPFDFIPEFPDILGKWKTPIENHGTCLNQLIKSIPYFVLSCVRVGGAYWKGALIKNFSLSLRRGAYSKGAFIGSCALFEHLRKMQNAN